MARLSESDPVDSRPTQLFCIFDFYFFLSTYKYKGHTQVDRLNQVETDLRDLHVKAPGPAFKNNAAARNK